MAQYLAGPLCGIHFRVCVSLLNRGICASPILLFTLNFRSYNLIVVGRARWHKTYCLSIRVRYVEPTKSVWRTGCILCCCFRVFSHSICKLHICDWNSEMRARTPHACAIWRFQRCYESENSVQRMKRQEHNAFHGCRTLHMEAISGFNSRYTWFIKIIECTLALYEYTTRRMKCLKIEASVCVWKIIFATAVINSMKWLYRE